MSYHVPEVSILGLKVIKSGKYKTFLAYFDCEVGFVRLYGCVLMVNAVGYLNVTGPLVAYNRQRAVYISSMNVLGEMLRQVVPSYLAAGGIIPDGVKVSTHHAKEGELDVYLH